ncbi:SPFH domain-containing protein [Candidatus Dojkabacteria bacterium]|nr:SPFH domain-containing protein [Candidatus Dojkabacteria bacterium]
MGLFNALKNEVKREFIARPDDTKDLILYKYPERNIRMLTQLTVQEDEKAVFFKEGKVQGVLEPGTHTLDGKSIPFLSMLIDAATGGDFFISEIYFVSTRQFTDLPFGGMIDNVTDPTTKLAVGIRLFGEYAVKVNEPEKLILNLVGTKNINNNDELTNWFKDLLLKVFRETVTDSIVNNNTQILGIASKSSEFEKLVLERVKDEVSQYGVEIPILGNVTISLKEEDEQTLKQMTRDFAYSGNMAAADAAVKLGMADALKNNTGAGGNAAGAAATGMGIAMGMNAVNQNPAQSQNQTQPAAPEQNQPTTQQPEKQEPTEEKPENKPEEPNK